MTESMSSLDRPPGLVAVAGASFGAALIVTGLFSVILSDAAPWLGVWGATCGVLLIGSGVWAWARPQDLVGALFAGSSAAAAGLGASLPAVWMGVQAAMLPSTMSRPDLAVFDTVMGIECACYLAFAAVEFVRGVRLDERAQRMDKQARHVAPHYHVARARSSRPAIPTTVSRGTASRWRVTQPQHSLRRWDRLDRHDR
jgi:hypothetical protein